jgi:pimeloyl-ACP methyl ester carboxylesterase
MGVERSAGGNRGDFCSWMVRELRDYMDVEAKAAHAGLALANTFQGHSPDRRPVGQGIVHRCGLVFVWPSWGPDRHSQNSRSRDSFKNFIDVQVLAARGARPIVLIAHSLGGLICRQAILDILDVDVASRPLVLGLMTLGTPNLGTDVARIARRILPSQSLRDMGTWDEFLRTLNERWLTGITNGGDPVLPLDKRTRLFYSSVYGTCDRVVKSASATAASSLGRQQSINKNHRKLPRAESTSDSTYKIIVGFIRSCLQQNAMTPIVQAADALSDRVRNHLVRSKSEGPE